MGAEAAFPRFEKLDPALRNRILDAALGEFGRYGYSAASMNRLVKGAGISKGALFKYFGTKAGVFHYACHTSMVELKEQLRFARNSTRGEPFFSRLEKVFRAGLRFTSSRPLSAAVYFRVLYTGDAPDGNRILLEIQRSARRFLENLLEEGVKSQELRPDIDPKRSAFVVQSVLDCFLQAHYLESAGPVSGSTGSPGSADLETASENWIHELKDFFQYGLEKRPRSETK